MEVTSILSLYHKNTVELYWGSTNLRILKENIENISILVLTWKVFWNIEMFATAGSVYLIKKCSATILAKTFLEESEQFPWGGIENWNWK